MRIKVNIIKGTKNLVEFHTWGLFGMDLIAPIIEAGYIIRLQLVEDDENVDKALIEEHR